MVKAKHTDRVIKKYKGQEDCCFLIDSGRSTRCFPNRLSEHLQTFKDSPTLKYSPSYLFQQDRLNSGRGTVFSLERLRDKQASSHLLTLEYCVQKDSEAAFGFNENYD